MDPKRPTSPARSSGPRPRAPGPPGVRRRPRPSRQTFLVRRVVVLGVVAVFVSGLVAMAKSFGDASESEASDLTTVADSPAPTGTGDEIEVTDPGLADTVPVVADVTPIPTEADPARVLLLGDSEAGGLSPFLSTVLKVDGLTTMTTDYKVSSGLVRPDFYDWPARLRETVPVANPDIVVALFGGNDGQPFLDMSSTPVDSAEWRAEYGTRVGEVMDFLSADGRTLIWVGVPNGADAKLTSRLAVQNEVAKAQAAARPAVVFVDTWTRFSGLDGGFAAWALDPRDGTFAPVRSETDGFHLNTRGEEILATDVGAAIAAELIARGAPSAGDPTVTTIAPGSAGTYTIVADDTLSSIASRTGTTVGAIVAANGWADEKHVIIVGAKIQMPAKTV